MDGNEVESCIGRLQVEKHVTLDYLFKHKMLHIS